MSNDVRADTPTAGGSGQLPVGQYCGYGSCDRPPQHTGDHRCRCGTLVDVPAARCAWHTTPTRPQLTVLAERDAARAAIHAALEVHTPERGEWNCEHDDCSTCEAGDVHEGLICGHCYGFDNFVYPWPCPTAQALQGQVQSRVHLNAADGCAGFCCETITLRDGRLLGRCMLPEASQP